MSNPVLTRVATGTVSTTGAAAFIGGPGANGVIPIAGFNRGTFNVTVAGGVETVSVTISCDGGATFSTTKLKVSSIALATIVTDMATATTYYIMDWPAATHIKFTKSATSANSATVQYCLTMS